MACLTDDCAILENPFPECFTGVASWYFSGANDTAIIIEFSKGGGAKTTFAGTTDGSGVLAIDMSTDLDPNFFKRDSGWITVRAYTEVDLMTVQIDDSNGHGHPHDCARFQVGPATDAATWTYEILPH